MNSKENRLPKLIIVCGPTGAGKTSLALRLAHELSGEIISADSRQIYKYMNIGTAKPTIKELECVPHHLIDIITPDQKFTAGKFVKRADMAISEIVAKKHIPFIVGGTGFYIKSLLYGLSKIPYIPNKVRNKLTKQVEQKGAHNLHCMLNEVDPIAAQKIDPNDGNRIVRALEVFQVTGTPISSYWKKDALTKRYQYFTIFLNDERSVLYEKINTRVDKMVQEGLFDEFKHLLEMGYTRNDPGMNSLGYKEIFAYIDKTQDFPTTIELIKQHMRNYAKRQLTWFNKQKIHLTISPSQLTLFDIKNQIMEFLGHDEACCNS
ncbi:MAG: tRNA (adenosine(37)-N6)-dimethylallyltransferase MiaA [Candidatus Cloacimonas sp. 4484_140]|nr:MAG: tRNA (adenosine(37)-N6)-dimethylallyltransferase MiaA [Candidatus Cloacimonas sp. 4484_140]